jgi:hypothetical protein
MTRGNRRNLLRKNHGFTRKADPKELTYTGYTPRPNPHKRLREKFRNLGLSKAIEAAAVQM